MTPQEFITRWEGSAAAKLSNSQSFLKELCTLMDVELPHPTVQDEAQNTYVFEKAVQFNDGDGTTSAGRMWISEQGLRQACSPFGLAASHSVIDSGGDLPVQLSPVVRMHGGWKTYPATDWCGNPTTIRGPIDGDNLFGYKPVDWLIDNTPFQDPLLWWATAVRRGTAVPVGGWRGAGTVGP